MRLRRLFPFIGALLLCGSVHASVTLSDIQTAVRRNVRDTATSSTLQRYSDSLITTVVNEGQRDVVSNTWILSKSTSITLSAQTTYYTLPTDLIAIQRVTLGYGNLPEVTLQQEDADNANGTWETTGGTPVYFFQDRAQSNKIGVAPYPTASSPGTLRIIYYCLPTDLSSSSDVPFNSETRFAVYQDLLTWYATYRLLYIEGLWDKAKVFKDLYDTRIQTLFEDYGAKATRVPNAPTKEQKP
jgi:hypothetical protein